MDPHRTAAASRIAQLFATRSVMSIKEAAGELGTTPTRLGLAAKGRRRHLAALGITLNRGQLALA